MLSAKDIDVEERVNDLYSICHLGTAVCIATYWLLGGKKQSQMLSDRWSAIVALHLFGRGWNMLKSKFMVFLADEVHPGTSWNTMIPVVTSHMQLSWIHLNSRLFKPRSINFLLLRCSFWAWTNFRRRNIRLILHVHALRLCLLFWHDVKWLFCCRGKRVFLDRCCIHQNDEDLKQQGIEHLDVFLQLSDKMLVPRFVCSTVHAYIP